ncbi:MAG: hypothetical protein ACRET2_14700 [Steroidobacteraceae bacterium]
MSLDYDNVGGKQLEAAIGAMGTHGRIVLCGMVSKYAQDAADDPRNLHRFISQRLRMTGFSVMEREAERTGFGRDMRRWLAHGEVVARSTVFDGLNALPCAFVDLLSGAATGRAVVRIDVTDAPGTEKR